MNWIAKRSAGQIVGIGVLVILVAAVLGGVADTDGIGNSMGTQVLVQNVVLYVWVPPFLFFIRYCRRQRRGVR